MRPIKLDKIWCTGYYSILPEKFCYYLRYQDLDNRPRVFIKQPEENPETFYLLEMITPTPEASDVLDKYDVISGPFPTLDAAIATYLVYINARGGDQ
jgi:hypothetical protein